MKSSLIASLLKALLHLLSGKETKALVRNCLNSGRFPKVDPSVKAGFVASSWGF